MRRVSRRRLVAGVCLLAVIALVAALWLRPSPAHAGEHYLAGGSVMHGSATLDPELLADTTAPYLSSDSCFYDPDRHVVLVPVLLRGHSDGAMTFHVTATVANAAAGGGTQRSAVTDIPYPSSMNRMGTWVQVPLDRSDWKPGATSCQVTTTVTPGAWFAYDD